MRKHEHGAELSRGDLDQITDLQRMHGLVRGVCKHDGSVGREAFPQEIPAAARWIVRIGRMLRVERFIVGRVRDWCRGARRLRGVRSIVRVAWVAEAGGRKVVVRPDFPDAARIAELLAVGQPVAVGIRLAQFRRPFVPGSLEVKAELVPRGAWDAASVAKVRAANARHRIASANPVWNQRHELRTRHSGRDQRAEEGC